MHPQHIGTARLAHVACPPPSIKRGLTYSEGVGSAADLALFTTSNNADGGLHDIAELRLLTVPRPRRPGSILREVAAPFHSAVERRHFRPRCRPRSSNCFINFENFLTIGFLPVRSETQAFLLILGQIS